MWKTVAATQIWKKILQARDLVKHQIYWKIKEGNSSLWFDNWIREGDLYNLVQNSREWDIE